MASIYNRSLLCIYLAFFLLVVGLEARTYPHCVLSERNALLEMKARFPDPYGAFQTWNTSNCCRWFGVTCENSGHIVSLDFEQKWLGLGTLSPSIGRLSHLKILNMDSTGVSGPLPSSLGFLSELRVLDFTAAYDINGSIPESLGHLFKLEDLRISGSQLQGGFASFLGGLSELRSLYLADNRLIEGEIPVSFGNLKKLKKLDLRNCNLRGTIPASFSNLQALEELHLQYNAQLGGSIGWLGNLYNLQQINLQYTKIWGSIPSSVGRLSNLQYLDLDNTCISGNIPSTIGGLSSLKFLDISSTFISGSLPETIGSLYSLIQLRITNTSLSGSIPASLGKLSNLQYLALSDNHLSGDIPEALGSLHNLTQLDLSGNLKLTGTIPSSGLPNLWSISLGNNQITHLPSNMSHFTSLSYLSLYSNKLSFDSIAGVATLPSLFYLVLSNCGLTGNIPNIFPSSIYILELSQNSITGFETNLSSLHKLETLYLESNSITLDKLGGLKSLKGLQRLFFASNMLEGDIKDGVLPFSLVEVRMNNNKIRGLPGHMSNFTDLQQLDLDNNNLSFQKIQGLATLPRLGNLTLSHCRLRGGIPEWLATLQMQDINMGRSSSWPILDLSFNNISGKIPPEFVKNAKLGALYLQNNLLSGGIPAGLADMHLYFLNLSNNKLSGQIPMALANRGLDASSFEGKPGLCGRPLSPCKQ